MYLRSLGRADDAQAAAGDRDLPIGAISCGADVFSPCVDRAGCRITTVIEIAGGDVGARHHVADAIGFAGRDSGDGVGVAAPCAGIIRLRALRLGSRAWRGGLVHLPARSCLRAFP